MAKEIKQTEGMQHTIVRIGAPAVQEGISALEPYGIGLTEFLRASIVKLLATTDESRTDLVNDIITYSKLDSVEVRKKTYANGRPDIERLTIDVRPPEVE